MTKMLEVGSVDLTICRQAYQGPIAIQLSDTDWQNVQTSADLVENIKQSGNTVYGINTGFGALAHQSIAHDQLQALQENIVLSHAAGVGEPLPAGVVRLILLLKINSLAQGYSGIQPQTLKALIALLNADLLPVIPAKGSVGASGDLAPLAHMAAVLIGVGDVIQQGQRLSAVEALDQLEMKPITLQAKEGLALLNGTQVSTAIAIGALLQTETLFHNAIVAGSMSVEAAAGSFKPFDARIHQVRGQLGQQQVAQWYREWLTESEINSSHAVCQRVQDPYSLRCQPQVMGACWDTWQHVAQILVREANGVSDNPLLFPDNGDSISGGNFHAEPVAMVADMLALVLSEIAAMSERRIALLIDKHFSELPGFLVKESGLNSGFMLAHVTATALASENKALATPRCVDSMPTSANQEDHVSMATNAARRLLEMAENSTYVVAIELLAACQGVSLRAPLQTTQPLLKILTRVRQQVPEYTQDRYFAPDIEAIYQLIVNTDLRAQRT